MPLRIGYHQVHIDDLIRHRPDRPHDRLPEADFRHKVTVHHIHMYVLGSTLPGLKDLLPENGKIRRQNGRGQFVVPFCTHRFVLSATVPDWDVLF